MQRRSRLWIIPGLIVVLAAIFAWRLAREDSGLVKNQAQGDSRPTNVEYRHEPVPELGALNYAQNTPRSLTNSDSSSASAPQGTNSSHNTPLLEYRLKNTEKPLRDLLYSDTAILLRNALYDAAEAAP